jgi:formiminotetrahydrofolate cyclodeaminase
MSREKWDEALPLGRWLEAVASPQPLPAGGRVASVSGAFAAALVEKIGRIVLRSPSRSALHLVAEEVAARAAALRPLLLALGDADDRAYAAVMAARRAGGGSAASVPLHDAEISAARLQVALIEYCVEIVELAHRFEGRVGPALGADLATARYLAAAAARGAHGNVEADLANLAADPHAASLRAAAGAALARALQATGASGRPQQQPDTPQPEPDPGDAA